MKYILCLETKLPSTLKCQIYDLFKIIHLSSPPKPRLHLQPWGLGVMEGLVSPSGSSLPSNPFECGMEVCIDCLRNTCNPSFLKVLIIKSKCHFTLLVFVTSLIAMLDSVAKHWLPVNVFWVSRIQILLLSCATTGSHNSTIPWKRKSRSNSTTYSPLSPSRPSSWIG